MPAYKIGDILVHVIHVVHSIPGMHEIHEMADGKEIHQRQGDRHYQQNHPFGFCLSQRGGNRAV